MKVQEQFNVTWKADNWAEFCVMKDLLRMINITQMELDWEHEMPNGAMFSSDMESYEVFISRLDEEDVQSFGKLSDVERMLRQFKFNFKE